MGKRKGKELYAENKNNADTGNGCHYPGITDPSPSGDRAYSQPMPQAPVSRKQNAHRSGSSSSSSGSTSSSSSAKSGAPHRIGGTRNSAYHGKG